MADKPDQRMEVVCDLSPGHTPQVHPVAKQRLMKARHSPPDHPAGALYLYGRHNYFWMARP